MGDKHKGHKKDMVHAEHGKPDEMKKGKDKFAKESGEHETPDLPGADGFRTARADEDTYD